MAGYIIEQSTHCFTLQIQKHQEEITRLSNLLSDYLEKNDSASASFICRRIIIESKSIASWVNTALRYLDPSLKWQPDYLITIFEGSDTVTIPVMRIGEICITEKDIWQRGFAVFQIEWVVSETGLNWWNYLNSDLVFIVANINSPYDYIFRSPCWYVRR